MDINNILNKIKNYKTATAEKAEQERIATEHYRQADASTHKVGFAPNSLISREIIGVGFKGGGCCGQYDFFTDGVAIYDRNRDNGFSREATTEHLEKFIKKFPEFERAFYDYIEKVTK